MEYKISSLLYDVAYKDRLYKILDKLILLDLQDLLQHFFSKFFCMELEHLHQHVQFKNLVKYLQFGPALHSHQYGKIVNILLKTANIGTKLRDLLSLFSQYRPNQ